jgi:hypothetical protein
MGKLFNQKNMPGSRTMQMRVIPETDLGMRIAKLELSQHRDESLRTTARHPSRQRRGGPAEIAHAQPYGLHRVGKHGKTGTWMGWAV